MKPMISIYHSHARSRVLQAIPEAKVGSWIVVTEPTEDELDTLTQTYHLDRDNLTDAVDLYEAPRIETEDNAVYIFTRYCYPEGSDIATQPLLIIHTQDHLLTIARSNTPILQRLTSDQLDFITTQKTKTLLQILSEINRSYDLQMKRASKRILQLRGQMRQSRLSTKEFISIIELEEDLNEFLSALQPQALLFTALLNGKYLRLYEEDRDIIEDIERGTSELIEQARGRASTLVNMRQAYDAIATTNLNNTFKRLTSIAIFLTIPTIIGGLWGMNVPIPGQTAKYAYLVVLGIIAVLEVISVWIFRRNKWL